MKIKMINIETTNDYNLLLKMRESLLVQKVRYIDENINKFKESDIDFINIQKRIDQLEFENKEKYINIKGYFSKEYIDALKKYNN